MLQIEPCGEFHDSFFKQLWEMRSNDAFTDVVLQVAGRQEIPAHRVVLATHSSFIKNLLQESGYQSPVNLKNLDFQAMRKLIDYFYSGHLEITMADAQSIMVAVNHLKVTKLHDKISEFVVENLKPENCVDWFLFASADEGSMQIIHHEARMMMSQKFREVVQTSAFLKMDATHVIRYLGEQNYDHDAMLDAAFVWIEHDIGDRRDVLEELLGNMQLQKCSPMMLKYVMEKYSNSLMAEFHILKMFTSALLLHIPSHQVPALPPSSA